MNQYEHEMRAFVERKMMDVLTKQRNEGVSEPLLKLRQEGGERLVALSIVYARDWAYTSLIKRICTRKIEMLSKATTKKEVSMMLETPKPYFDGNRYSSTNPYHVDEEKLLLWLCASLRGPLGHYEFERCWELFERTCPEEAKQIESTGGQME